MSNKTKNTKIRQRKFCEYMAMGESAYQSCINAGYSSKYAKTNAHKLREKYENEIEKLKPKAQKVIEEKFNYSVEQSFKKLCEIQNLALQTDDKGNYSNISAAIKAEELKGKMYGLYEQDNKQKAAEPQAIIVDEDTIRQVIRDTMALADES